MGSTKTSSTTTVTATPEESALNAQNLKMLQFMEPYQKQNYADLSTNISAILNGTTPMAQGIGGIDARQTQEMVNAAQRDLMPGFQSSGLVDSGSAFQAGVRSSADIRNTNAQFNVSAAQNLFNLAVGGQSNLQSQGTQLSSVLGSQLAGLRSSTTSGSTTKAWGDYAMQGFTGAQQATGTAIGFCWVAAELFGGWNEYKTCAARFYIMYMAPKWFRSLYGRYGEGFAKYIKGKPLLKMVIRPLFEMFVLLAESRFARTVEA